MYVVAIVGSRHRGWTRGVDHQGLIEQILAPRIAYYGDQLNVVSIGCDVGFGKAVKEHCEETGIKFFEVVVYFNGPRSKEEYARAYNSRHAALIDCADEFHVTVSSTRSTNVEDLIDRIRTTSKPYAAYDENNVVLEANYEPDQPVQLFEEPTCAPEDQAG